MLEEITVEKFTEVIKRLDWFYMVAVILGTRVAIMGRIYVVNKKPSGRYQFIVAALLGLVIAALFYIWRGEAWYEVKDYNPWIYLLASYFGAFFMYDLVARYILNKILPLPKTRDNV